MSGITRDFSVSKIEHLQEIIRKNVDEDGELALVDWVKDWFMDDLDIHDYINDIDTYHANMVDKYDISIKKFDAILEKVHAVDISYADRFNCVYEGLNSFSSKIMNVTELIDPSAVTLDTSGYAELLDGIEQIHTKNMEAVKTQIENDESELDDALREVPWYETAFDFIAGAGVELVKNNIEGMCYIPYAILGCFTDRDWNEDLDLLLTNAEEKYILPHIGNKQAYYYGKAAGDVITMVEGAYGLFKGAMVLLGGITITAGGTALTSTGVLAEVGAPAIAISVPVVAAGAAEMALSGAVFAKGAGNFNDNIKYAQTSSTSKITGNQGKLESGLGKGGASPKVNNMNEFFEGTFGSKIKKFMTKTSSKFQGQPVYEVAKKVENQYLKKGDKIYLDNLHRDHLEVFDKRGNAKAVLNLDGTLNYEKTEKVLSEGRKLKIT